MITDFFLIGAVPASAEIGHFDPWLVLVSYCVAVFGAYIALTITGHVAEGCVTQRRRVILCAGAVALGGGIWSMHFVGMLAYKMRMTIVYDPALTICSLLLAVLVSYGALQIACAVRLTFRKILLSAIVLGSGISLMHYSGMAAMQMEAQSFYQPLLFVLSIIIAIAACGAALWIVFWLGSNNNLRYARLWRFLAALVMGGAVCGMHYTGMAAAVVVPYAGGRFVDSQDFSLLAIGIALIMAIVSAIALALVLGRHERRLSNEKIWFARQYQLLRLSMLFGIGYAFCVALCCLYFYRLFLRDHTIIDPYFIEKNLFYGLLVSGFFIALIGVVWLSVLRSIRRWFAELEKTRLDLERQIHEKKLVEQELQRWIVTVEQAKAEALQAKENAEKTRDAQAIFLASMSHEIRTPMNGIMGMTQLLQGTPMNAEQRGWTEIVRRSGEHLLDIINDILDFSKIEAGKMVLDPIPFDLQQLIQDVCDIVALRTQEKGLELLVSFAPNTPRFAVGDVGRLKQIILNLVGNAIKFTQEGHVLIRVGTTAEHDGFVRYAFAIEDSGIGISADRLGNVFEKFTQAESSTTRRFGGTGLGLAIARELVMLMDGNIQVVSTVGEGTTFSFDVRLGVGSGHSALSALAACSPANQRVLLVGGYKPGTEIIQKFLHHEGMRCNVLASPKGVIEALSAAYDAKDPYLFVIIDDYGGRDQALRLAEEINKAALPDTMVVLLTTQTRAPTQEMMQQVGVRAYHHKPCFPETLTFKLRLLLEAWQKGEILPLVSRHNLTRLLRGESEGKIKTAPQFKHVRALVADDLKINQILMAKVLTDLGCIVDKANNGYEAIRQMQQRTYQVVFMDCQMPEMDGFAATRAIRALETEQQRHTTIIALTADAMAGDREKCLEAGMDDYINKPFKLERIMEILKQWCAQPENP